MAGPAAVLGASAPAASAADCSSTYASGGNCSVASATATATVTLGSSTSGVTATVTIPAGALPAGTVVSVVPVTNGGAVSVAIGGASSTSSSTYIAAFSISWTAPGGSTPTATKPITLTVKNPAIKAGDVIYELVGGKLEKVGTAAAAGIATITFSDDPVFLILRPARGGIAASHATLSASKIAVRVSCTQGKVCSGTAYANVTRKKAGGWQQIHVASGTFSVAQGTVKTVNLTVTKVGASIIARQHGKHFRVGVVLLMSSGARSVHLVEVV